MNATPNFRLLRCACSWARWSHACARTARVRAPRRALSAVAFIHRFGSSLNAHLHFHCVVIDGVFDSAAAGGVIFRAATGVGAPAIAAVQQCVRRRLLRLFVRRGLLPADDARAMAQWDHGGGFSVATSGSMKSSPSCARSAALYSGSDKASFTGERFPPQCSGEIAYEHWHRYAFARPFATGKVVLDVASGEGYGAALLATVAAQVHGVDIDPDTVHRASRAYACCANLCFVRASCIALPFPDRSFDVIVSFETIEHIDGASQVRMLGQFDRVLTPGGILILSSPNRAEYLDAREARNEFHAQELYRDELAQLIARHFEATRWFNQRIQCWSGIWSDSASSAPIEALSIDDLSVHSYGSPQAMYCVVLAARSEAALARPLLRGSILTDRDDSVAKRYEAAIQQLIHHYKLVDELTGTRDRHAEHVLHLKEVVRERDGAIDRQERHVHHLEQLVLERERAVEREAVRVRELATAVADHRAALETARQQADALQREVGTLRPEIEQLLKTETENQNTIRTLQRRAEHLSDVVRRMYSWRWWLRIPFRRARGDPPAQ